MAKERISVKESAIIAERSERTIRDWAKDKKIISYKVGGWFIEIDKKSLLAYLSGELVQ